MRISDWSSDVCSSDLQFVRNDGLFTGPALNQITLPAHDYAASVAFYKQLGLKQIVDSPGNGYARFEAANGVTLSIHLSPSRLREGLGEGLSDAASEETGPPPRSEEHTSELQSLMRISYAVFCLKKNTQTQYNKTRHKHHNT